jgi:hypothetical protein
LKCQVRIEDSRKSSSVVPGRDVIARFGKHSAVRELVNLRFAKSRPNQTFILTLDGEPLIYIINAGLNVESLFGILEHNEPNPAAIALLQIEALWRRSNVTGIVTALHPNPNFRFRSPYK